MEKDIQRVMDCVRKIGLGPKKINTTLYDLIEAVIEEVGSGESELVTPIVLRLLGQVKPATIH